MAYSGRACSVHIRRKNFNRPLQYFQLPPCEHLPIMDSSKISGESYTLLTQINYP